MKKIGLAFITLLLCSCGILDDGDDTATYTYRINNQTGITVSIAVGDIFQEVSNNSFFECSYSETSNLGLCQKFLEIIFIELNKGYSCSGAAIDRNGKCFVEDGRAFNIATEGGIFKETRSRFFEYTLTPELLERAFELPLNE
ncbi:MAG: hypothetical protein AAGF77_09395 [Bacteroidota bacterium]